MMECTARLSLLPPPAPQLPPFQTLLIHGNYPASSPFHLCLSQLSWSHDGSKSRPILVTAKNQSVVTKDLVDLNDDWLTTNAGRGSTADLLSHIQIFYPGTPDLCALIFSLLRTDLPTELGHVPTNLGQAVSLIVLHEPSTYFLNNDRATSASYTMSSYLRLITSALASLRSLGTRTNPPPLVVFDSRLQELTLPILPVAVGDSGMTEEEEDVGPGHRHSKVGSAVERYFDLIGRVEVVPQPLETDAVHASSMYRMTMMPNEYYSRPASLPSSWNWQKVQVEHVPINRATFKWSVV